jgi:biotin synthase
VSTAEIEKYPFLARDKILAAAGRAASLNVGTFCMVISGRAPGERVFGKVLDAVREVKATYGMNVCACLGLLTEDHVRRLEDAGVDQVNHNLNSSARFTGDVVTTHRFEDRVATVEHVARSGMKTCSGGIIGMGESDDDVIDLALSLRALDVKSVPVNFLIPIPGTPFAARGGLDPRRCLRVLCLYRFILPSQEIRIAGGREVHLRSMQPLGLYPANSIFIGDYLTTPGQSARADFEMIRDAGFVLEDPDGTAVDAARLDELLMSASGVSDER